MGDTQWEELDGDGSLLKTKGQAYVDIADAIVRSMGALNNITDQIDNKSLAMDKTRKVATDVRDSIKNAEGRYRETGAALVDYGTALIAAKGEADPAAQMLRTLRDEYDTAQASASAAEDAVEDLPDNVSDADKSDAERQATSAGGEASRIAGEIAKYESQWQGGKDDKDTGARNAVSRIDEQFERDEAADFTDGFWDNVGQVWDAVYKWVKIVCDIAGVLAIFLSWVPILGQVLVALAAIGAVLAIIDSALKYARGQIGLGGLLVGVGLGVLSLAGGKIATHLTKVVKLRSVTQSASAYNAISAAQGGSKYIDDALSARVPTTWGQKLASPFVRSDAQQAVATAFKNRPGGFMNLVRGSGTATLSNLKNAFPLPFKGGPTGLTGISDMRGINSILKTEGMAMQGAYKTAMGLSGAVFVGDVGKSIYSADQAFNSPGQTIGNQGASVSGVVAGQAGGSYNAVIQGGNSIYNDLKALGAVG